MYLRAEQVFTGIFSVPPCFNRNSRDVLEVTFCPIHCTERCLQEYDTPGRSSRSEYRSDRKRRSSSRLESNHTSDYCSTFRSSDHPRDNRSRDHHRRSSSRLR